MSAGGLKKELSGLPEGWIVLLETKAEDAMAMSLESIKYLTSQGYRGIVVSASRPYSNLSSIYEKNGIDMAKVFCIDCVSKRQTSGLKNGAGVVYIENVAALTSIAIALGESYRRFSGKKFVFIDSVTTMLIHNRSDVLARFVHSVLTNMRIVGVSGLLVSIEGETNREVRSEIAQLCDKIVKT